MGILKDTNKLSTKVNSLELVFVSFQSHTIITCRSNIVRFIFSISASLGSSPFSISSLSSSCTLSFCSTLTQSSSSSFKNLWNGTFFRIKLFLYHTHYQIYLCVWHSFDKRRPLLLLPPLPALCTGVLYG